MTRTGALHFSLARSTELLASVADGDLAREVAARAGSLPVLRLPFDGPGAPAAAPDAPEPAHVLADMVTEGWDTAVRLELRDRAAVDLVRAQLAAVDDTLLLALPGLATVEVRDGAQQRTVRDVEARWVVATRTGTLDPVLLTDRPVEERGRAGWQITWAAPRPGSPARVPQTVLAPTPTDEPCTVPAVLVATFPLDPSRRWVAPGRLTDELVRLAGEVWTDLLAACRPRAGEPDGPGSGGEPELPTAEPLGLPDPLDLIPAGLPAGALDAALRTAVLENTRRVPLFAAVGDGPDLTAADALVLDGPAGTDPEALAALAVWHPNLVAVGPRHWSVVRLLDLMHTDLSDLVDALPGNDPVRLRALYDAFAGADGATLEQLATLPVPLADGRVVRGARGLVLAEQGVTGTVLDLLGRWGVRFVHPDAAHPLLHRLGATSADAATLLDHPVLRDRVLQDGPLGDEPTDAATTVLLSLVTTALADGARLEPAPWWGEALLPAADGEPVPARGLVLPGSPAADWFDPRVLPPVADEVVERWGDALEVIGVRSGPTVLRIDAGPADRASSGLEDDAVLLTEALDGWDDYLADLADLVPGGPRGPGDDGLGRDRAYPVDLPELTAVADLDAVRPQAWPEVLAALTSGAARSALVEPVRLGAVRDPSRTATADTVPSRTAPSYTAWWLRHRADLGLGHPFALGRASHPGSAVTLLLGPAPRVVAGLDREVQRALGGVVDPRELDPAGWVDLLDALPAPPAPVDLALAVALWRGLTRLAVEHQGLGVDPDRLPALLPATRLAPADPLGRVEVVRAHEVAVATAMWAQHPAVGPVLVVASAAVEAVADLLDLDLAEERAAGVVTSTGHPAPVPDVVRSVFPAVPPTWVEHEDLLVDGWRVDWWVTPDGTPHAATTAGLADALADVTPGADRGAIERLLLDAGSRAAVLLTLAAADPTGPDRTDP